MLTAYSAQFAATKPTRSPFLTPNLSRSTPATRTARAAVSANVSVVAAPDASTKTR